MNALLLALTLAAAKPDTTILCPAYPDDPPWRWMTCYVALRIDAHPDRPWVDWRTSKPWVPRWEPVEEQP